jgi:hypothetical protein
LTQRSTLRCPADPVLRVANDVGRRHRRTGRWIGLSGQIAADLLPEAGDSWAVEAEQGL